MVAPVETPLNPQPGDVVKKPHLGSLLLLGMLLIVVGSAVFFGIDSGSEKESSTTLAEAGSAEPLSLAVLPFENLDQQRGHHNFARAITADLTTDLSKLSRLWVISASTTEDTRLPARYLVTGSVQHTADRLSVNVRLLESQSHHQIWSERYDQPIVDLFDVQLAISQEIVEQLAVQVTAAERIRLAKRYTRNLAAYENFLSGQEELLLRQQHANRSARDWYRQAIEKDPSFARAYAGLALSYAADYRNRWVLDGEKALQNAANMAQTAHQIDPNIPEVYWVLGYVDAQQRRLDDALHLLGRAIELDRSYADAYALMGGINTYKGEPEKTLPLMREAMRLKPDAGYLYYLLLGRAYFFLGDYDQSRINLHEALARNPEILEARIYLIATSAAGQKMEEAAWELEELANLDPKFRLAEWLTTYPMIDELQRKRLSNTFAPFDL